MATGDPVTLWIAQLKHGLTDMRALYDNDLRFLEQFG